MKWNKLHLFEFDPNWPSAEGDGWGPMCSCGHLFKHPIHLQHNGDVCDILMFPCSCGSWHPNDYVDSENVRFMQKISAPGYQPTELESEVIKIMTDGA